MSREKINIDKIKSDLEGTKITDHSISNELENSFLEYAMSVITSRALPDVRDGLKPVHRRILYAAFNLGMTSDKPYKKSARLVGEVIGKFHPHGDSAVYEAAVRMAQPFSLRYPLVDGHGNFGSIDGDRAAAMRYTEIRLSKICNELLKNIDKNTVNFRENYDGSEIEPSILPAGFPNLLANGSTGIAVGMSTTIPPHNLTELINASIELAKNPEISILQLMDYIKGPDLPTKAEIIGNSGIINYFNTGRGSVTVRSKYFIEDLENGKSNIIITEIPYMVNKSTLIERIVKLVKDEMIEGIADLRDETSRKGIRIVIETKRDIIPEILLNKLYKSTELQTKISVNMIALVGGVPTLLNIKQCLEYFLIHQIDVLTRKTKYDLKKSKDREHILEGLFIAVSNIDEIIKIIKESKNSESCELELINIYALSQVQAKSILDMRLRNISSLERDKIKNELSEVKIKIQNFELILSSPEKKTSIICDDMVAIRDKYGDNRITEILYGVSEDINDEDLIPIEDIVISMSKNGYLKRIPVQTYRTQNRGGMGVKGVSTHNDDDVKLITITSTHSDLLFFTDKGKVYKLRAYKIPSGSRISKGMPALNLIDIDKGEKILSILATNDYDKGYLFLCTVKGIIKKTSISEFISIRKNGKIAISLRDEDTLFKALISYDNTEIYLGSTSGHLARFEDSQVRPSGRTSEGVRGMRLEEGHKIIGFSTSLNGDEMLSIGENGIGKLTLIEKYRLTKRGAKGVSTLKINTKTGNMIFSQAVSGNEDLLMLTSEGKINRISLTNIRTIGRATSGVKMTTLPNGVKLQSATTFTKIIDDEEIPELEVFES